MWINPKYTDNTQAHDHRSGTLTWGGWLKGNLKQKIKTKFQDILVHCQGPEYLLESPNRRWEHGGVGTGNGCVYH